ncbi:YraN family protein [Lichenicoccus sp.]|uniref:YraN family protein n=1 Tax=Lichenicoccus sp. TaxID=2781899 RepID=UPI003D1233D0
MARGWDRGSWSSVRRCRSGAGGATAMPSANSLSVPGVSDPSRRRRAQARGVGAESLVCQALARDGWTILLRRARTACGEIDIVASLPKAALIAFVEVKARAYLCDAACALSLAQRRRLIAAAGVLLAQHPEWAGCHLRFDLVLLDHAGQIRRIADAFRIGDDESPN